MNLIAANHRDSWVRGNSPIFVICLGCGSYVRWAVALADLDGPAFKAFYHPACAREAQREQAKEG